MGQQEELIGIDRESVQRWLLDHVPDLEGPLDFSLVSGGRSNLTYGVEDASGGRYALRRPPTGGVLATAHDVSREWRFISALADTGVPVPPPVAFCDDPDVTGSEFYLMKFVDGLVLQDAEAGEALEPAARRHAADQTIDVLVALHQIDPHDVGLDDMVRSTGYVERQLRRWKAQLDASGPYGSPLLDEVYDLLHANVPAQESGIVHGDYRPGNISYAPDGTALAIFDWELATTGDPLADLGWLLSTWQEPREQTPPTTPGPSTAPGFPDRDYLTARYAQAAGKDISGLPYWIAFSRWRSACIGAGVRARYAAGHMADDGYAEEMDRTRASADQMAEAARAALREAGI